jgi:hypothetical protein
MERGATAMDDDWERDPSVRSMRRVFSKIEETQKKILQAL